MRLSPDVLHLDLKKLRRAVLGQAKGPSSVLFTQWPTSHL